MGSKPFLKWVGGKRKLLKELEERMPSDFSAYFEPFMGGGAVFWHIKPKKAVLLDINPELVNTYRCVQKNVEALILDLRQHYYDQEYYYQIRNSDRTNCYSSWTDVQRASRFIYLNKTCFNGLYRVNSQGQNNVPFGKYKNPKIVDVENLRACSLALQSTEILTGSFLSIESKVESQDFVYFDPPYIPLNATSSFTSYSKEDFGLDMQIALRDLCHRFNQRGVRFMLSNSSAPVVFELYSKFKIDLVDVPRSINSKGDKRGKVKEVIVTNY